MSKLSVIIPYRNREEHLKIFIPYMMNYLQGLEFTLNIVEQYDTKSFNRAKLLNVGFDITKNNHDYFCFHDVDMLPVSNNSIYSPVYTPTHLACAVEQFNWGLPYNEYFGGVTLIDKQSFLKINGFSNNYWGWGAEDDDFLKRCLYSRLELQRRNGRYKSLYHPPNGDTMGGKPSDDTLKNRELFANTTEKDYKSNGILNVTYDLEDKKVVNPYTTIYKVKI